MSESITENPAALATPTDPDAPVEGTTPAVPETDLTTTEGIQLALAMAGDAVVAEENLPTVLTLVTEVGEEGAKFAKGATSLLRLRKYLASLSSRMMPYVFLPSGLPDWAGSSSGFRTLFDNQLDAAFDGAATKENKLGKQERKNLLLSIKAHIKSTYRDPIIRDYVWSTVEAVSQERDIEVTDKAGNVTTETVTETFTPDGLAGIQAGLPWTRDPDSPAFISAVRAEYVRCDIAGDIPAKYLSESERKSRSSGGPGPGPEAPAEIIEASVKSLAQMSPQWGAAAVLQSMSALVLRITDLKNPGEGPGKLTSDYLERVQFLADWSVRYLAGKAGTMEEDDIVSLLWNEKDRDAVTSV